MTPFNDYGRNCNCYGDDGCNLSCTRPTWKQTAAFTLKLVVPSFLAGVAALLALQFYVGFCMGKALTAASGVGG